VWKIDSPSGGQRCRRGVGVNPVVSSASLTLNPASFSYELRKNVRLGLNGYWLQQTTDHRINDVVFPIRRSAPLA
jgi:hypothetical protein